IVSTAGDLARFFTALLGGRLLPPDLLAQMLATQPTGTRAGLLLPDYRYGLGVHSFRFPCGTAWGHDGDLFGYFTDVHAARNGSRVVVLMVNAPEGWVRSTRAVRAAALAVEKLAFCGRAR